MSRHRARAMFRAGFLPVLGGLLLGSASEASAGLRATVRFDDPAEASPVEVRYFHVPEGSAVSAVRIAPGPVQRVATPPARPDAAVPEDAPEEPGLAPGFGTLGGHALQAVVLRPLRKSDVEGEMLFTSSFDVEIALEPSPRGPASDLERLRPSPQADGLFLRALAALVENPEDLPVPAADLRGLGDGDAVFAPEELPSVDGSGVDMVIVTVDALADGFQPLADWKTRKGVPTVVRTVEWIEANYPSGHDTPERIREFLRDAYRKWGTWLVLLGGDWDQVPARVTVSRFGAASEAIPTDQYYACLEGNWNGDGDGVFGEASLNGDPGDQPDLLPDAFVGRAPVETLAEVATFLAKSLTYEKSPPPGWAESFGGLGEVLFPSDWTCAQPLGDIATDGKTIIEELDLLIDPSWARSKRYQSDCDLDRDIALEELSFGHHLLAIVGHGDAFKFAVGEGAAPFIYRADLDTLSNAPRLSFVITVSCNTNQFDVEPTGESFLHNPVGGAVAVLSTTRGDYPGPSRDLRAEMLHLAFQEGITRFGAMTQLMRLPLVPLATDQTALNWTLMATNYCGDPELRFWTREPGVLLVSHPATLPLDAGSVTVTVTDALAAPVADALVCLSDASGAYARGRTGAAGQVSLPLRSRDVVPVDVVVTHAEFLPYEGTITLTQPAAPFVSLIDAAIDDDGSGPSSGNGDGVIDAGETLEIVATARNAGGALASNVSVFASVEPGSRATFDVLWNGAREPSRVRVGPDGVSPAALPFTLDFASPLLEYRGAPLVTIGADPAAASGVFLWQDHEGWHVEWSGGPDSVQVTGTIATDGRVRSYGSVELESTDALALAASEDTLTFGGLVHASDPLDGVDLRLADSTMISVGTASAAIGTLAPGATGAGTVTIDVSPAAREGQVAAVDLLFQSTSGGPWAAEVPLLFAGPDLVAWILTIDDSGVPPTVGDGDGVAELGETVRLTPTVRNRGTGEAPSVQGIVSATSGIAFADAVDSYGDIASLGTSSGADGYVFTLVDPTGTSIDLVLTDAVGRAWAKTIDFVRPAAPSNLTFTSDETSIALTWDPGTDSDLAGYNLYRSASGGGVGFARRNVDLLRSGARFVDTGLMFGTTFWYRVTAVDSAGNESLPSAERAAWTVQRQLPGWPQVVNNNVYAPIALADADGGGTGEVYVGSIDWDFYGWEADGTLKPNFPIEGLNEIWGAAALADLDGDGELDIVWGSRDTRFYAVRPDGTPAIGDTSVVVTLLNAEEIRSTPVIADVDRDGELEILFGTDKGGLFGFNHDGTPMNGTDGLLIRVPMTFGLPRIWGPIAVADLDGDEVREIVFTSWNDSLYVVHADGSRVPGFPRGGNDEFRGGATLGDLDADGTLEIVAANSDRNIYVYDHDGSDYVSGGILATLPDLLRTSVTLANLDGDPQLEVLLGSFDGRLYAFNHDGSGFLGPGGLFADVDSSERISASPIVVDVDGDADFEIFVGHRNGNFYGYHHDGTLLPGFPVPTDLEIFSTASAGDLDGDGDIEIAFGSYDRTVNVLDFDGPSSSAAYEWPTYAGNHHRSSVYGEPGPGQTGVDSGVAEVLRLALLPGGPNPFHLATTIGFAVPAQGPARLQVFNVSGRLVRTLVAGPLTPGRHVTVWDGRDDSGRDVAAGVYFFRLQSSAEADVRKVVRLR